MLSLLISVEKHRYLTKKFSNEIDDQKYLTKKEACEDAGGVFNESDTTCKLSKNECIENPFHDIRVYLIEFFWG